MHIHMGTETHPTHHGTALPTHLGLSRADQAQKKRPVCPAWDLVQQGQWKGDSSLRLALDSGRASEHHLHARHPVGLLQGWHPPRLVHSAGGCSSQGPWLTWFPLLVFIVHTSSTVCAVCAEHQGRARLG